MAFDILFAMCHAKELNEKYANAKVEKVNQPTKENVILSIRNKGENVKIIISSNASCARISETYQTFENPSNPPMFTMLLRKHLQGTIISKIDTYGFDRIICIHFNGYDELGDSQKKILICELMGKYSNIILTDDKYKILGVNRPIDITENRVRQILTGMTYECPPVQEKILPCDVTKELFEEKVRDYIDKEENVNDELIARFILKTFAGISPITSNEILYRCNHSGNNGKFLDRLFDSYMSIVNAYLKGEIKPCAVIENGKPVDFSYTSLSLFGEEKLKYFDDLSSLLEFYYVEKERNTLLKNRLGNLETVVKNLIKKSQRKINALNEELAECKEMDKYKRYGELITGSLYMLKGKSSYCDVIDYYSENTETVRIPLDEKLTPSQNASKYYKKYNKLKSQKENASIQLEKTYSELDYLMSVLDSLGKCTTNDDVVEIREELRITGYLKEDHNSPKKKKQIKYNPFVYTLPSGMTVRVGKNNMQNEYITLKDSDKEDYWFHVKDAPGSHVVVKTDGKDLSEDEILMCASICAYYSQMKQSDNVPVDYTKIRYVKKIPNSSPGHVSFTNNKTVYVKPENLIKE